MSRRLLLRMTLPMAAVSLLLLGLGTASAWYIHRLQTNLSGLLTQEVRSVRAAERLEIGMLEVQSLLHQFLLTGDRRHLDAIAEVWRETDHWLEEAERQARTAEEQRLIAQVRQAHDHFFDRLDRVMRQQPNGPAPRQVRDLVGDVMAREILPPARAYLALNEETVAQTSERNEAMTERAVLALLLLGVCGSAAGLLAGYGFARGISRSMVQLQVPIHDAAGKLNEVVGPITLSAGRSFGELEGMLHRIAGEVGTVVEHLQRSQREVLRAEQLAALGQLAAGLAHELRNPLMSIKFLVQSAARRAEPAGLRGRGLAVVEEEIGRMEQAIQSFLDFARPPEPEKRRFELRAVIDQTVELVAGRSAQQGVRVERDYPEAPVVVEADVGQVRQVLLNLLLNALDAMPGGGTVRVRLAREGGDPSASPAGWLVLSVADSGAGLPAALGDKVFEPFVSTKETGTGLGLPICKRIVEAHGGTVAAASRPEGGAVFTVRLPLSAPPADQERTRE